MTDVKDIKADPADEFWMRQALETAKTPNSLRLRIRRWAV